MENIDVKQLYRMNVIDNTEVTENGVRKPKADHYYSYEMIYNSGIDGGWEKRRDGVAIARLFLLPSQTKYFTMDLSSKKKAANPVAEILTARTFVNFWNRLPSHTVEYDHEVFDYFERAPKFLSNLLSVIEHKNFLPACKLGLMAIHSHRWDIDRGSYFMNRMKITESTPLNKYIIKVAQESGIDKEVINHAISGEYSGNGKLNRSVLKFFSNCEKLYGLDSTKTHFVDKWFRELDMYGDGDSMSDLAAIFIKHGGYGDDLPKSYNGDLEKAAHDNLRVFDPKTLSDYLFYGLKRQGLLDIGRAGMYLKDTYRAQETLYGKIKEKYPPALATLHDQMNYKIRVYESIQEADAYLKRAKDGAIYEGEAYGYVLKLLSTTGDVIDEATQMANCVKTYIKYVINGQCFLMGLRRKATPDESLVTVEIRNGEPVQIYRAHNTPVTAADKYALWTIMKKYYDAHSMTEKSAKAKAAIAEVKDEAIAELEAMKKKEKEDKQGAKEEKA